MHAVYVIQNDVTKEIYIGHTTDLKKRLATHNARGAKHTTRMHGTWKYIYVELYRHDDDARARERAKVKAPREWQARTFEAPDEKRFLSPKCGAGRSESFSGNCLPKTQLPANS